MGHLRYRIGVYIVIVLTGTFFTVYGCDSENLRSASFLGLGTLPSDVTSQGFGISADGLVVVGASFDDSNTPEAFRWMAQSGMVGLGTLPNMLGSFAQSANRDGSVIGGSSTFFDTLVAFRWTEATGLERLTPPDAKLTANIATGISADGTVIVGGAGGGFTPEAYRWTAAGGLVGLGTLSGGTSSCAEGVSADGNVITGASTNDTGEDVAFRWTSDSGMIALPLLAGAIGSEGFGISADGNVIVGGSVFPDGSFEATLWNNTGAVGLGKLPGHMVSSARATSQDGSVVVGHSSECIGCTNIAFIWNEQNGIRSLRDVLVSVGLSEELQGWVLMEANAISDDGHVITGIGENPSGLDESFIATLP